MVIQNRSTNIRQHLNLNENDKGEFSASSFNEKHEEFNAIAIFVKWFQTTKIKHHIIFSTFKLLNFCARQ